MIILIQIITFRNKPLFRASNPTENTTGGWSKKPRSQPDSHNHQFLNSPIFSQQNKPSYLLLLLVAAEHESGSSIDPSLRWWESPEEYRSCRSQSWTHQDHGKITDRHGFHILPPSVSCTLSPFLSVSSPQLPCSHTVHTFSHIVCLSSFVKWPCLQLTNDKKKTFKFELLNFD